MSEQKLPEPAIEFQSHSEGKEMVCTRQSSKRIQQKRFLEESQAVGANNREVLPTEATDHSRGSSPRKTARFVQLRRSPRIADCKNSETSLPNRPISRQADPIREMRNQEDGSSANYQGVSGSSEKSVYSVSSQPSDRNQPSLRSRDSLQIVVEEKTYLFKIESGSTAQLHLTNHDLRTLKENHCLNDGVINAYIKLLSVNRRAYPNLVLVNTYFYSNFKDSESSNAQQRIHKIFDKMKLNEHSEILVPVHWKKKHWVFIMMSQDVIRIFDSIENKGQLPKPLLNLQQHLFKNISIPKRVEDFPQQSNDTDCGVFALCGIRSIVLGIPFEEVFLQSIPKIRKHIAGELCAWKIMGW